MSTTSRVETVIVINCDMGRGILPSFRDSSFRPLDVANAYAQHKYLAQVEGSKPKGAVNSTMQPLSASLKAFFTFCANDKSKSGGDIPWDETDGERLGRFRDYCFEQTLKDSRNVSSLSAKRTTNIKLTHIYDLFVWAQEEGHARPKTIGMRDCRIKSSLVLLKERPDAVRLATVRLMYPAMFSGAADGSRAGRPQHWPTPNEIDTLVDIFRAQPNAHASRRNILLTRIGEHSGWRAASVLSLTTDQFSDELIQQGLARGDKRFQVTPPTQKLGYSNSFGVPWELAFDIQRYVGSSHDPSQMGPRQNLIADLGTTEGEAQERVFLACGGKCAGHPLTPRSLSEIFSAAFELAGAQRRAAYHSLRRGFGDKVMRAEILFRIRNGLSTAMEEVVHAVAQQLGHRSKLAYRSYTRVMLSLENHSVEEELRDQVASLQARLSDADAAHQTLRELLDTEQRLRERAEAEVGVLRSLLTAQGAIAGRSPLRRPLVAKR